MAFIPPALGQVFCEVPVNIFQHHAVKQQGWIVDYKFYTNSIAQHKNDWSPKLERCHCDVLLPCRIATDFVTGQGRRSIFAAGLATFKVERPYCYSLRPSRPCHLP